MTTRTAGLTTNLRIVRGGGASAMVDDMRTWAEPFGTIALPAYEARDAPSVATIVP
jgi:hypothetical protein